MRRYADSYGLETADNRIMVVDYSVNGDSFVTGKPHLWSDKQIFDGGVTNWALAPDGKLSRCSCRRRSRAEGEAHFA